MAHLPPAQNQVEINHANFYTLCAYSINFSKGVDLDLLTVQGYMKVTLRHYRHVHCTACWTHPEKFRHLVSDETTQGRRCLEIWNVRDLNPRLMHSNDKATNHCTRCLVVNYTCLNSIQLFSKSKATFFSDHLTTTGYLQPFCSQNKLIKLKAVFNLNKFIDF